MLAVFIILVASICSLQSLVLADDVFASSAHLRLLADGEQRLVEVVNDYISAERSRLKQVEQLLHEVRVSRRRAWSPVSSASANLSLILLEHPLNAFFLIQRFQTTWNSIDSVVFDEEAADELDDTLSTLEPYLPGKDDYRGARLALARLQRTYNIPVEELMNGIVAGRQSQPLSQRDVLEIGLTAVSSDLPDDAISWFTAGLSHNNSPLVNKQEFYHGLARAHALKKEFLKAVDYVTRALELDPGNAKYLENLLPESLNYTKSSSESSNYLQMCYEMAFMNETKIAERSVDREGSCELQQSQSVPYQFAKVEYVHRSPDIILFHDFVSQREAEQLRKMATRKVTRARVGGGIVSDIRIGKTSWLWDDESSLVSRISDRISDVTHLDIINAEALQMSNYGLGGYYALHYDAPVTSHNANVSTDERNDDDRIATFMIYLNDVTLGGATVFPKINVGSNPVKNAAIFWYNYDHLGSVDKTSLHAACPVLLGEKWVANKWIHQYWQEFRRRCPLNM